MAQLQSRPSTVRPLKSDHAPLEQGRCRLKKLKKKLARVTSDSWPVSRRHAASSKNGPISTPGQSCQHRDALPVVLLRPKFPSESFSGACFLNAKSSVAAGVAEGQGCGRFSIRFSWGRLPSPAPSQLGSVRERTQLQSPRLARMTQKAWPIQTRLPKRHEEIARSPGQPAWATQSARPHMV